VRTSAGRRKRADETHSIADVLRVEELVLSALLIIFILIDCRIVVSMSRVRVANGQVIVVIVNTRNSRTGLGEGGVARNDFEVRAGGGSIVGVGLVELGDGDVEHAHEGFVLAVRDL